MIHSVKSLWRYVFACSWLDWLRATVVLGMGVSGLVLHSVLLMQISGGLAVLVNGMTRDLLTRAWKMTRSLLISAWKMTFGRLWLYVFACSWLDWLRATVVLGMGVSGLVLHSVLLMQISGCLAVLVNGMTRDLLTRAWKMTRSLLISAWKMTFGRLWLYVFACSWLDWLRATVVLGMGVSGLVLHSVLLMQISVCLAVLVNSMTRNFFIFTILGVPNPKSVKIKRKNGASGLPESSQRYSQGLPLVASSDEISYGRSESPNINEEGLSGRLSRMQANKTDKRLDAGASSPNTIVEFPMDDGNSQNGNIFSESIAEYQRLLAATEDLKKGKILHSVSGELQISVLQMLSS